MERDFASAMPLPLTPEQITAEWLARALGVDRPGVVVTGIQVEDVILGTSTKIRVALQYAEGRSAGLPARMIVKGGFEEHSPKLGPMYLNEIRFYRDIRPFVDLRTPDCFFAGSDPNSHQSIVIMEDLRERGVTFCSPLDPQSYEAAARRLRALGRYHAQSWNSPEFAPGKRWDWVRTRFSGYSTVYNARYLDPDVWRHYMRSPRGAAVSVSLHDRDWMERALQRLGEIDAVSDTCLLHGDTHLGNLYVDIDDEPGFLDMQVTRSNWALEVAYHIGCGIDVADRRRWESALLETYLAALREKGVSAPSFDEAWLAYARALAYGYFIFVINETRFQTESVNTANVMRMAAAMIDHGTKQLLS